MHWIDCGMPTYSFVIAIWHTRIIPRLFMSLSAMVSEREFCYNRSVFYWLKHGWQMSQGHGGMAFEASIYWHLQLQS